MERKVGSDLCPTLVYRFCAIPFGSPEEPRTTPASSVDEPATVSLFLFGQIYANSANSWGAVVVGYCVEGLTIDGFCLSEANFITTSTI